MNISLSSDERGAVDFYLRIYNGYVHYVFSVSAGLWTFPNPHAKHKILYYYNTSLILDLNG